MSKQYIYYIYQNVNIIIRFGTSQNFSTETKLYFAALKFWLY